MRRASKDAMRVASRNRASFPGSGITTIRGICFRSRGKRPGWIRCDRGTVLAQSKSRGLGCGPAVKVGPNAPCRTAMQIALGAGNLLGISDDGREGGIQQLESTARASHNARVRGDGALSWADTLACTNPKRVRRCPVWREVIKTRCRQSLSRLRPLTWEHHTEFRR